jgi:hypothetical protein
MLLQGQMLMEQINFLISSINCLASVSTGAISFKGFAVVHRSAEGSCLLVVVISFLRLDE